MRQHRSLSISGALGCINADRETSLSLPEKNLWIEVLVWALDDLQRVKYRPHALAWIRSNGRHIGSFLWVCEHLNLNCEAVRRSLRQHYGEAKNVSANLSPGQTEEKIKLHSENHLR